MISLPAADARRRGGDPADPRACRPAGHQAAAGASARSARARGRSTRSSARSRSRSTRALKASQIFGATCMRCILGGDPERPQIEMHIDNMVKAVRGMRSRIVDSGVKLAVENHGGDLQAREMKMMIEAVGTRRDGRLPRLGQPGVDARGSAHDARDADSLRRDVPRPRQRRLESAGGHRRALGEHGRRQRRHRRLDQEVHPGQAGPADHLREPGLGEPAGSRDLRPEVLGQLAQDAGLGVQPLPGGRREGHAEAGRAAAGGQDRRAAADRGSGDLRPLHARAAAAAVEAGRSQLQLSAVSS